MLLFACVCVCGGGTFKSGKLLVTCHSSLFYLNQYLYLLTSNKHADSKSQQASTNSYLKSRDEKRSPLTSLINKQAMVDLLKKVLRHVFCLVTGYNSCGKHPDNILVSCP